MWSAQIVLNLDPLILSSVVIVRNTEGLERFFNVKRPPSFFCSGVKNSSPHDGENVLKPSKSTSTSSLSLKFVSVGRKAAYDSLPA